MSSRSREREDHALRTALYDDFQDYIVNTVRSRDNPTICLKAFDMVKQGTDTHLEVVLENADSVTSQVYELIEKGFRAGTKMKSRDLITNGAPAFHVYIPLKVGSKGKNGGWSGSSGSKGKRTKYQQPNQNLLMIYIIGFCALIIFAILKTSAVEWRQLPFFPF